MVQSIWSATAVTPAATHRIPVDTGAAGSPSRWTGQQIADASGFIGKTHNALGSISTNTAINLANGTYVSATIGGNLTFTITNPPASPNGCEFTLVLTNGGAYTITWPGSVLWAGGTAPTLTASGANVLHFATGNGGTNWYGWAELDEQSFDAGAITSGTLDNARLDAELAAIAGLTSAADKGVMFSGVGTAATFDLSAAARTVLDDATTAAMLTTLGAQAALVSGTNIKTINSTSLLGSGDIAISASPGGSSLQPQYNAAGSFAGMSGWSWDNTNTSLTVTGATVTASKPLLDMAQTWNNAATLFTAEKTNVINTASAAGSLLRDWQVGGSSVFRITKPVALPYSTNATLRFNATSSSYFSEMDGYGHVFYTGQYTNSTSISQGLIAPASGHIAFGSTDSPVNNGDVYLRRDAANTLAQRNGTTTQEDRLYRSYTDASNYSRLSRRFNTTTAVIHAEGTGTGSDGSVAFNDAALSTSATVGFVMIPSCAGTPTGVPADIPTGQCPMVVDSSGTKLYVYVGGAWKSCTLT